LNFLVPRVLGWGPADSPWDNGEVLRAELFSIGRLEQHAASLAAAQRFTGAERPAPLSACGSRTMIALLAAYRAIVAAVPTAARSPGRRMADRNYHLVEDQIREVAPGPSADFLSAAPQAGQRPFNGYPRVFGLAWAFVAHTDSRSSDTLRQFVRAISAFSL